MSLLSLRRLFIFIVSFSIVYVLFITSGIRSKLKYIRPVHQAAAVFIMEGFANGDTYSKYTIDRLGLESPAEINDINSFRYPINDGKKRCRIAISGNKTSVFVLIVSSAINSEKRNAVRKSWIRQLPSDGTISYSFFIGLNQNSSSLVKEESEIYRDIVQVNVADNYYSLTEKSVSMLHWSLNFCPQAKFILKIDDDIYLNAINLAIVAQNVSINKTVGLYGKRNCDECPGGKSRPFRDPKHRHYTSIEKYPWTEYPPYISGGCYMIASEAVGRLLAAAKSTPYYPFEDLYLTGFCASKADITSSYSKKYFNVWAQTGKQQSLECYVQEWVSWQTSRRLTMMQSFKATTQAYSNNKSSQQHCKNQSKIIN